MSEKKSDDIWESLSLIDRSELMERFVRELPYISGKMETTPDGVVARTGIDSQRAHQIANGKRKMKWSEYMSILFVLWDDEVGRWIIEEDGYFPEELKKAMKSGQNARGLDEET